MAFKVVFFTTLIALSAAGLLSPHHVSYSPRYEHHSSDEGNSNYHFSYSVNAPQTGDIKSHEESRNGDRVQGKYSLVEPDGLKRTVQYTADDHSGFQATVSHEPSSSQVHLSTHTPHSGYNHHYDNSYSYVHFSSPHASYHF